MTPPTHTILEDRGILAVHGEDARSFLQGLISNDVDKVSETQAIHAALLTPQGKYLHDFFVVQDPAGGADDLYLDCERARLADLMKRLKLYKLRSKATLADETEAWTVAAIPGADAAAALHMTGEPGTAAKRDGGVIFGDPRLGDLGLRAILPAATAAETLADHAGQPAPRDDYDRLRLSLGVPDGSRDLIVEKSILLESGFDELNGVDWTKGCYMGQELTARTKYRGLIKKRLMPVEIKGAPPAAGTPLTKDGKEVGEMRSAVGGPDGGLGLALVRLEHFAEDAAFDAGGAPVAPRKPAWAEF